MNILKTWIIPRIRETRWPRGQNAPAPRIAKPLLPVVAVIGLPGSSGLQAEVSVDLAGWYQMQKEL